ncbi:MAG: hypothetical protein RPR97_09670 [Colwellia sp.]|jgi:hypothetical protein
MSFLKKLGSVALKVGSAVADEAKEISALAETMSHLSDDELRAKIQSGGRAQEKLAANLALKKRQR